MDENKWINVKDRLPPIAEEFLVYEKNQCYVAWHDNKKNMHGELVWHYSYCCGCRVTGITHWMPLPKMPEENK